ncbi:hypothetical protein AB0J74_32910, partial [Asanoa sp. NPDC049573]|uniref:hypothetical protein n=1 Tax=Asanoa sp. NPDC049573 TaxID=3155396 RepID=UPI00343F8386
PPRCVVMARVDPPSVGRFEVPTQFGIYLTRSQPDLAALIFDLSGHLRQITHRSPHGSEPGVDSGGQPNNSTPIGPPAFLVFHLIM